MLDTVPIVEKIRVVDLGFHVIDEVLLVDGDHVVQAVIFADGDHRIAHLKSPPIHHFFYVDVFPFTLHGLHKEHHTTAHSHQTSQNEKY